MSSTLAIDTDELLTRIAGVLGINRTYSNWDATTEADVRGIIRSGLRRFYSPLDPRTGSVWRWRHLEKQLSAASAPVYETGTIAISGGTVTGSGTTFPSWAADGILRAAGNSLFVTVRGGDTSLTIENDVIEIASGTSYELHRWKFALPTDFGSFQEGVLYNHADYPRRLRGAGIEEIRLRYASVWKTGQPTMYGIIPPEVSGTATIGTGRGSLAFYPTADTEAEFSAAYLAVPEDRLDNSDIRDAPTVVQVDAVHAETLLEAILASAEDFLQIEGGTHTNRYAERLAASIAHDRTFGAPIEHTRSDRIDYARLARLNHVPTMEEI